MGRTVASTLLCTLTSLLIALSAEPLSWAAGPEGFFVSAIAINPQDSNMIYALTTYSIGVLKSTDGGQRWTQINQGIHSYSLYQLTVHPKDPKILYLGAGGAGLYKSTDRGASWVEMNEGLQNTDIGTLILHPHDPETVYAVTSTGLFKSPNGGKSWIALNQGDNFTSSQQYQSLVVLPTTPPTFFLASSTGLYTRQEGDGGWVPVGEPLIGKKISALARDPQTGRLYAAVVRRGETTQTLREGGLFVSEDGGKSWTRLGQGLEGDWIRSILIDPVDPQTLYLTTSGRGILKSRDGGKSWKEINVGLTETDRDFRALVMDPHDPKLLYAGSHGNWIYQSRDGGAMWNPLPLGPHQTAQDILAGLAREGDLVQKTSTIHPPAAFEKCNRCHGWTDSNLNAHKGTWRVTANRRDWSLPVKRMSKGAGLTPEEEVQLAGFLNTYTQGKRSPER
jgi:photosystem II stability/assembly factor-like uncharacterized protein